jgi:hypothetical protein
MRSCTNISMRRQDLSHSLVRADKLLPAPRQSTRQKKNMQAKPPDAASCPPSPTLHDEGGCKSTASHCRTEFSRSFEACCWFVVAIVRIMFSLQQAYQTCSRICPYAVVHFQLIACPSVDGWLQRTEHQPYCSAISAPVPQDACP